MAKVTATGQIDRQTERKKDKQRDIENYNIDYTRASVVPVQSPIMTKNLVMTKNQCLSFESIYIIDKSIYLDLPREEQTDRCTDCRLKK